MLLDLEIERDGDIIAVEVRLEFHPTMRGARTIFGSPIEPDESAHWEVQHATGPDGRLVKLTEAEIARAEALALNEWREP
ncbi:MAG: hypothetical protein KGJ13_11590 [Patescibacteria group bacterium]|nr:hypothetical protein [Patescibacteria group bacterium]